MAAARVVILGGGFAGVATARALERMGNADIDVTLVSRQNFMLFTPMLPEVAAGTIEAADIVQPLRTALAGRSSNAGSSAFELGEAVAGDLAARTVTVRHPLTGDSKALEYDELVLALGSTVDTMGIPGADRFAIPFKSIADAELVRSRVVGALEVAAKTHDAIERDRLARFAIVGGGFSGVELAGELQGFLDSISRYYPAVPPGQVEVVLLESGDRLLAHLPAKFGRYAACALRRRGTTLMLGKKVGAVDGRGVELQGGERIASATVIWVAGEKPSPPVETLGLRTTHRGAVEVGADFAVVGAPHVWALGDCAAVPNARGGTYAPLAQNAIREGPLLARNIVARLRRRPTRNFRYRELGQMASLGNRQALAELPGGHMLTGFVAWLMWRAYYLGRLPGLSRKAHVAFDWALGLIFPPGTARLPMIEQRDSGAASR